MPRSSVLCEKQGFSWTYYIIWRTISTRRDQSDCTISYKYILVTVFLLVFCQFNCCCHGFRYLDPDPSTLLAELDKTVNKTFHKLNKAITTLVSNNNTCTYTRVHAHIHTNTHTHNHSCGKGSLDCVVFY